MLRQRLVTGVIAGVVAGAAILWLPLTAVLAVVAVVLALAAREWARLAGVASAAGRGAYMVAIGLAAGLAAGLLWERSGLVTAWLIAAGLAWLLIAAWLVGRRDRQGIQRTGPAWGWLGLGLLLLPGLAAAFAWLLAVAEVGRPVLLFAIVLVWVADSGAYFSGRAWGRHRLAPRISAGKTWEGVAGGLAAVAAYAALCGWLLGLQGGALLAWLAIAVVAGGFSIVGDLLESVLKRHAGVKDSGAALPGHGGLLDRGDSLLAALPVFAVALYAVPLTL